VTLVVSIGQLSIRAGDGSDAPFRLEVPELKLERGSCVAITGPSGCGKSTLLEVLGLLRRPMRVGRFQFSAGPNHEVMDLTQPGDPSVLRQGPIGYVPQMGGVLPFLTARAQVAATLHLAGCTGTEAGTSRLDWLTAQLGLSEHLDKRRDALSGGQRKRVSLLAGLSVPRILLIADEPTAGLDAEAAQRVMHLLASIALHEGSAVIIATHDLQAADSADFTTIGIRNGRLADTPVNGRPRPHD
jgi:putative ABC transport system ATP-binding protein